MVKRDYFKVLSNEEKLQYKFKFCELCQYHECELIGEYTRFRENHAQDHKSQFPVTTDTGKYIGTVIGVRIKGQDDEPVAESGFVDVYSHSFDEDILSYDQLKLEDDCIMNFRHVYQVECGRNKVSDGIGDHYKIEMKYDGTILEDTEDRWEPIQPVFISAQTGQGKNYFIERTLIPYVRILNLKNNTRQKVLILSNRLALQKQIKNRLNGYADSEDGQDGIYFYNEFADVMTYQSILRNKDRLEKVQNNNQARYIFVICDEAHFFTSDAMFNPHTQKILSDIVCLFKDAVRVYMSATPYECLEYIIKEEEDYEGRPNFNKTQHKCKYGKMVLYHFKRDYNYLHINTYSELNELYEEIIESVAQRKEKWLIFIDDKEKCKTIKTQLEALAEKNKCPLVVRNADSEKKAEKVLAVDVDSKKDPTYQEIVNNERLNKDTSVLISTSVLDNGVNLTGIKNIVVSEMTKTKCMQMVGRARVSGVNDRKTLYIKRFDINEVKKHITYLMKQQDAFHSYELAYGRLGDPLQSRGHYNEYNFLNKYYNGDNKDWENAKHWFGRPFDKPTELYQNEIAKSLLNKRISFYRFIYDEMVDESAKEDERQEGAAHVGQKYLEYQLSWFGKIYCVDDDITFADKEKAKKKLIDFLESYVESGEEIVAGEMMDMFKKRFIDLYDAAFSKSDINSREYGAKKMNDLLKKQNMRYEIEGKPQAGPWTVIRFDCFPK